jgi:hypothetical protein
MTTTGQLALSNLVSCRNLLQEARVDALAAATSLDGSRAEGANKLADQISDALGHLHRLVRALDDNELDELACGG